jgi:AAA+ superfamily predicted ATPase
MDESLIGAIASAVAANPGNLSLRAHFASLLLQAGRHAEALEQCTIILAERPDHLEALDIAAQASSALGDRPRADAYRRLHDALDSSTPSQVQPPIQPQPPPPPVVPMREQVGSSTVTDDGEIVGLPDGGGDIADTETPSVTLADVGGMEEIKRRLNLAFLAPLRNPGMMKMYGKSMRGGLLLYGPPGCGKTFIARATAGELGAHFISIGLADVLDMWMGESEKNVARIFEMARRNAPCVIFLDEIDALGRKRSLVRHSAVSNTVTQLLAEMDGARADNEGVFVLAATNHPWDVDTALRRPGRLDRMLLVVPPDREARAAIVRYHLRNRPVEHLDPIWLASQTEDFSGADLAYLCEAAAELAMEDSLNRGVARPIGRNDFKKALGEIRPSTRAWFQNARNYAMFANDGGIYDELLGYMRSRHLL